MFVAGFYARLDVGFYAVASASRRASSSLKILGKIYFICFVFILLFNFSLLLRILFTLFAAGGAEVSDL